MVKPLEVVSSSSCHIRFRICDGTEILIQSYHDWWIVDRLSYDLKSSRREYRTYEAAEKFVEREHLKAAKKILASA